LLCDGHLVLVRAREVAEPHRRLGDLLASEIDQTVTRLAADRPHDRIGRLIIIQRHRHTLYWTLTQGFERVEVAATLRVLRDRRRTDRRDPPQPLLPGFADRRWPGDRRRALPPSWAGLGLLVTSTARMDGPSQADSADAKFGPM
jgi:hypothetical protein